MSLDLGFPLGLGLGGPLGLGLSGPLGLGLGPLCLGQNDPQVVDDLPVAIRTDGAKLDLLANTEVARIPYPCQFPTTNYFASSSLRITLFCQHVQNNPYSLSQFSGVCPLYLPRGSLA